MSAESGPSRSPDRWRYEPPAEEDLDKTARKRRRSKRQSTALPVTSIPDMRFEQSFLASVRSFIHEEDAEEGKERATVTSTDAEKGAMEQTTALTGSGQEEEKKHHHSIHAGRSSTTGEPELWLGRLRVEWLPLLRLTLRDQFLSPIIQGAVFAIGGIVLGSIRTFLLSGRGGGLSASGLRR